MTAWLGVVPADHVRRAVAPGIAQIGHGTKPALARMRAGDVPVYCSPRDTIGGTVLQGFTAIGGVADDEVWQADEGEFRPWRRRFDDDVSTTPVPLEAVRDALELTSGPDWGHQLRRGLVELSDADVACLAAAMGATR